ncbi:MAG: Stp1/IreP family PP2C-type Ser/Thr phosphatase [Clostridia bacterium]
MNKHYAATHPGKIRKNNEDSFVAEVYEDYGIYVLADGMGGYSGGEIASKVAVETSLSCLKKAIDLGQMNTASEIKDKIKDTINRVNKKILTLASRDESLKSMGTTIVLAVIFEDQIYYSNVGDSRLYMLRKGEILTQLTVDDTYVGKLLADGLITEKEAEKHPQRHMLTKAVGIAKKIDTSVQEIELKKGDILLLCSDGVTNMIDDIDLQEFLIKSKNVDTSLEVINEANKRGGQDNITTIVIYI